MKKILFICGVLPDEKISDIINNSKENIDFAAHNFQRKIIEGFEKEKTEYDVISVPFISSYPKYYKKKVIPVFEHEKYTYCKYLNLPYLKILSRYKNLKKQLKIYLKENSEFNVVVYSLHFPFIKNIKFIKNKFKDCKINLVVPDLQEYMSDSKKILYSFLKKIEIKLTKKYLKYVDSYVFLTEYMNEKVNVLQKPYNIIEGISNTSFDSQIIDKCNEKYICYTGTLAKRYGIMNLVEAFKNIKDKNCKLVICGNGEMADEIIKASQEYSNIIFKGLVSPEEAKSIQTNSFALINPRGNNEEYTKYSFPSKIMEYISTGKPVICYKLDGFPQEYDDVLIYPDSDNISCLTNCIDTVLEFNDDQLNDIRNKSIALMKTKTPQKSIKKILHLFEN